VACGYCITHSKPRAAAGFCLLLLLLLVQSLVPPVPVLQAVTPVWQLVQQLQRGDARHEASILQAAAAQGTAVQHGRGDALVFKHMPGACCGI
jgi:hypothetical protein